MNKEFNLEKTMLPPWLMYPEISNGSIGWRMGYGEEYIYNFIEWLEELTDLEQEEYEKMFQEPRSWRGFYDGDISKRDNDEFLFEYENYWIEFWKSNGGQNIVTLIC